MEKTARILIVEDEKEYWKPLLNKLDDFKETPLGLLVQKVKVDHAKDGETAQDFLKRADQSAGPYDIILLDLVIAWPKGTLPKKDEPENGLTLLDRYIPETQRESVLVYTVLGNRGPVREALRLGAYSYVLKNKDNTDELFRTLAFAYRNAAARRANMWLELKERHRSTWLQVQRERQAADRLSHAVTDHMSDVLFKMSRVAELLSRDFGVDFEARPRNPIAALIEEVQQLTTAIAEACAKERNGYATKPAEAQKIDLRDLLQKTVYSLQPGMALRGLRIESTVKKALRPIRTFSSAVESLLTEVFINAIENSPPSSSIKVSLRPLHDGRWNEIEISSTEENHVQHRAPAVAGTLAESFGGGVSEALADGKRRTTIKIPDLSGK